MPSRGTGLGFEPHPQLGVCERKPIDVSLAHQCFSPSLCPSLPLSLKIKSLKNKNKKPSSIWPQPARYLLLSGPRPETGSSQPWFTAWPHLGTLNPSISSSSCQDVPGRAQLVTDLGLHLLGGPKANAPGGKPISLGVNPSHQGSPTLGNGG